MSGQLSAQESTGFEYVDLKEVDPNFKTVADGFYTLKVIKAFLKEFTYGPAAKKAGQTGQVAKFQFAITDDSSPERGRRVFASFFSDARGLGNMRRIMDATGVVQDDGEDIASWLEKLVQQGADFKTRVGIVPAIDFKTRQPRVDPLNGKPIMDNEIYWKEAIQA